MPKYYCDYCDTFLTHDSVNKNNLYTFLFLNILNILNLIIIVVYEFN